MKSLPNKSLCIKSAVAQVAILEQNENITQVLVFSQLYDGYCDQIKCFKNLLITYKCAPIMSMFINFNSLKKRNRIVGWIIREMMAVFYLIFHLFTILLENWQTKTSPHIICRHQRGVLTSRNCYLHLFTSLSSENLFKESGSIIGKNHSQNS